MKCIEKINLSPLFLTGSEKFRDEIETKLGIRLALNKRGRPRKKKQQVNEGVMLYEIH